MYLCIEECQNKLTSHLSFRKKIRIFSNIIQKNPATRKLVSNSNVKQNVQITMLTKKSFVETFYTRFSFREQKNARDAMYIYIFLSIECSHNVVWYPHYPSTYKTWLYTPFTYTNRFLKLMKDIFFTQNHST